MDKKTALLLIVLLLACATVAHLYFDRDRVAGELFSVKENARLLTEADTKNKTLKEQIEKIQSDQKTPVNNYYVAAPTVKDAAQEVKNDVREGKPAAKEITSIPGDKTLIQANEEKQRVEVYRVTVDKKRIFGGWATNKAVGVAVGYDRVILMGGKDYNGKTVVGGMYVVRF